MEIQINSKTLCVVQLSPDDIYELLKDQSITYQMKEKNQVLNLVSPFQDHRIYLENCNSSLPHSVLENISFEFEQMGFDPILIQDEEDKKKHFNQQYADGKNVWLSFLRNDQRGDGISVYFSFNQVKSSRQLANHLIHSIAKHSSLPINGTFFEWKNLMNNIFLLSNSRQNIPDVVIAGNELADLSNFESTQLSESLIYALAAFYNQRAFVDISYYFLNHEKNTSSIAEAVHEPIPDETVSEQENTDSKPSAPVSNPASIAEDVFEAVLEPTSDETVSEQEYMDSKPSAPVQPNPTLAWVYQQMAQPTANRQQPKSIASFVGYINKLTQLENLPQHKEENPPINMLTIQRRK